MAKRPGGSVFLFFVVGLLSFSFQACKPKKIRVNSASEPQKSGNTNQSVNSFVRVSVNAGIVDSFAAQFPHNYWFNQNNIEVNHDCRDDVIAIQLAPSNNNGKELFCRVYSPSENRWEEWQDCQSLTQSRFEDLEEGVQKFQARCTSTDFAGNVIEGLSNTVQWGTDTIPPLVRPSAGNTKYVVAIENNVPVVQFESLDDLSSVNQDPQSASAWKKTYCRITGSVQTSWRDCSQPLPTLNDGDYELEIRAEDFAGNISDIQSEAFRVGRSHLPNEKGSCRLLAQPEGNTKSRSGQFSFSCEDIDEIDLIECKLDAGDWIECAQCSDSSSVLNSAQNCSGNSTFTELADGRHRFIVRGTDKRGDKNPELSFDWVIDNLSPVLVGGTPTISSGSATFPFSYYDRGYSEVDPTTVQCQVEGPGLSAPVWDSCVSPFVVSSGLELGKSYTVRVRASDYAENQSRSQQIPHESYEFTWVNPDDEFPSCSISSSHTDYNSNETQTVHFNCATNNPVKLLQCRVGEDISTAAWGDCSSEHSHSFNTEASGEYQFQVRMEDIFDQAGESVLLRVNVDQDSPSIDIGHVESDIFPSFRVSLENIADHGGSGLKEILCRHEDPVEGSTGFYPCGDSTNLGTHVVQVDQLNPQSRGLHHSFFVKAVDHAGNESEIKSANFQSTETVERPDCSLSPSFFSQSSQDETQNFVFAVESGREENIVFECRKLVNGLVEHDWEQCDQNTVIQNPEEAQINLQMRCYDNRAAELKSEIKSVSYIVDRLGPTARINAPQFHQNDSNEIDAVISVEFENNSPGSCQVAQSECRWELEPTLAFINFVQGSGSSQELRYFTRDWHLCGSPVTLPQAGSFGHKFNFEIRVTDCLGNIGEVAQQEWSNGFWGEWSDCDAQSCGVAGQRTRHCTGNSQSSLANSTAAGRECLGDNSMACQSDCQDCNNGALTPPACTDCPQGMDYHQATAQCLDSCPANELRNAQGDCACAGGFYRNQNTQSCEPVRDGIWTEWSEWTAWTSGACLAVCGQSGERIESRTRSRVCIPPSQGGSSCEGSEGEGYSLSQNNLGQMIETHTEILRHSCDGPPCRIDGGWTSWSDWTEWTEDGSCDSQTGMAWYSRNRTRSCSNPLPSGGGQSCSGESLESEREQRSCKIDGGWTDWTEWEDDGSCQANGKRRQKKTRQCTQPLPRNGGAPCEGANVEYRYVDCCYGGTRTMSAWCSDSDSAGLGCQLQVSCNSGCRATDPRTRRYGSLGEGGSYSNIVTNGDTATATWRNDGSLCSNCTQTGRLDVTCRE